MPHHTILYPIHPHGCGGEKLPADLKEAKKAAATDGFVRNFIPAQIMSIYCGE